MSEKRVFKGVTINGKTYYAHESLTGGYNLSTFGGPHEFTARIAYAHIDDLYFVYDSNGNKVGEFNTGYGRCSGAVTSIQM